MPCVLFCQYCLLSNTESEEITDTVNKAYYNCFKFSINVVIMSQISYCSNCEVKICDNPGLRVKLRAQRVTQRTSTWKTEACSVWSQSQQWLVFISVYEARTRVTKHKRGKGCRRTGDYFSKCCFSPSFIDFCSFNGWVNVGWFVTHKSKMFFQVPETHLIKYNEVFNKPEEEAKKFIDLRAKRGSTHEALWLHW